MFDYLKYYLSPLLQIITAAGIFMGGPYVWLGVATLPVLAVLDAILPIDKSVRKMRNRTIANIPVWIATIFGVLLYGVLAWNISLGTMTVLEMIGAMVSVGWISVIVVVPSAHELYHQRGAFRQFVGIYSQVVYLDCTRHIAHMTGHHLDVSTESDCDTAPRGKTIYSFTLNAVFHSTMTALKLEGDALEKRGKSRFSIQHHVWRAILAQFIFQFVIYLIGGVEAVKYSIGAVILARFWIESFNFFQHYGQVREADKPIGRRHAWNHLRPISRIVTFEITNHADHHLNAYTPYYLLKPDTASVELPSVFICFMAALVPPIWNDLIIKPALKQWDLQYASNEERELAKKQNEKAGWPNWFTQEQAQAQAQI